jgi:hypothetical protein
VTNAKPPLTPGGPPEKVAPILAVEPEKRTDAQKTELLTYYRSLDVEWLWLNGELAQHPLPPDKRLLGMQDLAWAMINNAQFLFNH